MTDPKGPTGRLSELMAALEDATEAASDEEILAAAVERGVDVDAQATRVRSLLLGAVTRAKRSRMTTAQTAHRDALAKIVAHPARLPAQPAARRELLFRTLQRKQVQQVQDATITLQFRDFESYSDSDVESALRDLDALGLLGDDEPER